MAQTKLPCNRAHLKVVDVDSRVNFDTAVAQYLGLGFLVATRGVDRARLEKKRAPLNPKYVLVGSVVPVFGWIFLVFYFVFNAREPKLRLIDVRLCTAGAGVAQRSREY